ncbi:MAG TPA: hypothetical protein P5572_04480 [Phycisphaerae bacterium]|nr:hypothetical protein [Phycisphaerales bacterium]HRX84256.1 hypothetical protein [Phycisphaerae bacterium]
MTATMTMTDHDIVQQTVTSDAFRVETAYVKRGGIVISEKPRLFKRIDDRFIRMIFPVTNPEVEDGLVVCMVCLWDLQENLNVYAHCISAGPGTNAQLRALYSPLNQVKPQPGTAGDKAIAKFVAWKQASWGKFLNEELELGTAEASRRWLAAFWKALDRMYGGGNLRD